MSEQKLPRLAVSSDGLSWDNPELLEELRSHPDPSHWAVWSWQRDNDPLPCPLQVTISVPETQQHAAATHDVMQAVGRQLQSAFRLFCAERGWPLPDFSVQRLAVEGETWSYQISLPGGPEARGELKPSKLLVMGDEEQLALLLGLETVDPILGLPARWIARSQLNLARSVELHLFDAPGLVAAHTLHLVGEQFHRALGFLQLQRWLLPTLPEYGDLLGTVFPQRTGLFSRTVKALIADDLWLPHPARFLEMFLEALSELEGSDPLDADLLKELIRRELVPENLPRFLDGAGLLWAVEWKGEPDGDGADQARLLSRLGVALHGLADCEPPPVVVTDFESRSELGRVLRGPYPTLPVLSWAEIPSHVRLQLLGVVDARFEVDPAPWEPNWFEVGWE